MKYVILKSDGQELPVLFDNRLVHGDVAHFIKSAVMRATMRPVEVISAGFIKRNGRCCGKSESLGLAAREEEDTTLVEKTFNQPLF